MDGILPYTSLSPHGGWLWDGHDLGESWPERVPKHVPKGDISWVEGLISWVGYLKYMVLDPKMTGLEG